MILAKGRQGAFMQSQKNPKGGKVATIPQPRSIEFNWNVAIGGRSKAQPIHTARTAKEPSNSAAVTAKLMLLINGFELSVFSLIYYWPSPPAIKYFPASAKPLAVSQ